MADLTGQQLGPYTLGALIGKGGMASVYRAHQQSMGRDVAIKIMAADLTENDEFVARFEREARVIARLQHPHILPVIDFGRSDKLVYLVMRLIEGGTLSARMRQTPLTLQQVNQLLSQIGSALEYAHLHGVIHRDLKPNNVLLDELDNSYLTDFGIAKMLAGSTSQSNLTNTGAVMGTPAYMAPEQWRSEPVDARTDIYALGIILYEMLIGALPFQAETPFGMMYKHFDSMPPQPRLINPSLPPPVEHILLTALAKNPADRYSSARQMAEEFSHAVQTMPPDTLAAKLPRATPDQVARATPAAGSKPSILPPTRVAPPPPAYPMPVTPPWGMAAPRPKSNNGLLYGVGAALAVLVIGVIAVLLVMQNRGDDDGDQNQVGTAQATSISLAELQGTHTADAALGQATAESTVEATAEVEVLFTATPRAPQVTRTQPGLGGLKITPRPTVTPSDPAAPPWPPIPTPAPPQTTAPTLTSIPTNTAIPSSTPNLEETMNAMLAQRLTQTAEQWTDTPTPNIEATVQAALTGTASAWTKTPLPTIRPSDTRVPTQTRASCTMRTQMRVNYGGRTTLYPDSPTHVRTSPGLRKASVLSIEPGQAFWVFGGPECVDDVWWYEVEGYSSTGRWSGWIGEGQNGTYWIEQFETGPIDCPGAPNPRMTPGEQGRITLNPPLPSRVRSGPGTSATILGQLKPGETFTVVSGPVCDTANHWRWWQIDSGRYYGWVAEGPVGEYWIEPY